MTDIRNLRLAVARKLKERRQYMDRAERSERAHKGTLDAVKSNVFSYEIENCADEIIKAVLDKAIEASEIIAQETIDGGSFEIGICMPSFQIRRRLYKMDMRDVSVSGSSEPQTMSVKCIDVNLHKRGRQS